MFHALGHGGAGQNSHQDAVGIQTVRIDLEQLTASFKCVVFHASTEIGARQQGFHIVPGIVVRQHCLDFADCLLVFPGFCVDMRQGAACQVDAGWLNPIPAAVQPAQFTLDAAVGGINLKGPLHMPDRSTQVAAFITDDAHPQLGNEIIRHSQQNPHKDVRGFRIAVCLQISLSHQPVSLEVLWESLQDVQTVSYSLFGVTLIDKGLNFPVVGTQGNFHHVRTPVSISTEFSIKRYQVTGRTRAGARRGSR